MKPIIIIGSGLAGYTLAREFRKLDAHTALHIITTDDGSFYSKPMLSNALSLGKTPDKLIISSAEKMAKQLDATVSTYTAVSHIDNKKQRLKINEQYLHYEKLVLAVGASPIRPPLQGNGAKEVFSVNSLGDYKHFHQALAKAKKVAIIGTGLIGCEFANDLAANDKQVTVIGPDKTPLGRLLPVEAGRALQHALTKLDVKWHLGTIAEQVQRINGHYRLMLSNQSSVDADVILSAIGLSSNLQLAHSCGLTSNRGIVVSRLLETSSPNIYAIGDCAEIDGQVLPFVMPLMHQARALASTLNGDACKINYPLMPIVIKTPSYPVVVVPPPAGIEGEWFAEELDEGLHCEFHNIDKQLTGFALCGSATGKKQALMKQMQQHRA